MTPYGLLHSPPLPAGYEFENEVKLLYAAHYQQKSEAVNGIGGDGGCDILLRSEMTIVQVYGPDRGPYRRFGFDDRVCRKIQSEAKKVARRLKKLTKLLGGKPEAWRLVIPEDPSGRVIECARVAFAELGIRAEVLGFTHLSQIRKSTGFDIDDHQWSEVRKGAARLPDEPIYGTPDTLRSLYVPPIVIELPEAPGSVNAATVDLVGDVRTLAADWKRKFSATSSPLVVFGDYGSGKSSLLKMIGSELADESLIPTPIFVPLREAVLRSHRTLRESLVAYVESTLNARLTDDDWIKRPKIWILDGFDELNVRLQKEEDLLVRLLEDIGQLATIRSNLVIMASRRILFLKNEHSLPRGSRIFLVRGFDDNAVENWIGKWRSAPHRGPTILTMGQLAERGLGAEARNPLILFMLANLIDGELSASRPYLRAEIFRAFVRSTASGRFELRRNVAPAVQTDFEAVLCEIARVIFVHGHNEIIALSTLRRRFRGRNLEAAVELLRTHPHLLLVGHFFRRTTVSKGEESSEEDDAHVEFCHLSFREFLVAEAFLKLLKEGTNEMDLPIEELIAFVFRPFGDAELKFLEELLCLETWEVREAICRRLRPLMVSDVAFEQLIAAGIADFERLRELLSTLSLRKRNLRTIAYFVRSTIAARATDSGYRQLMLREFKRPFLPQFMTYEEPWWDFTDPNKLTQRVFRLVKGGTMGSDSQLMGVRWRFLSMREWAIVDPKLDGVLNVHGDEWDDGFLSTVPGGRVAWRVGKSSRSVFAGVCLLLKEKTTWIDCVFLDCDLRIFSSPDEGEEGRAHGVRHEFRNCKFIGSDTSHVGGPRTPCDVVFDSDCSRDKPTEMDRFLGDNARLIRTLIEKARAILATEANTQSGADLRPWGELVFPNVVNFEATLFGDCNESESAEKGFRRDETWRIARALEPLGDRSS